MADQPKLTAEERARKALSGCEHSDYLAPWTCPACREAKVADAIRQAEDAVREDFLHRCQMKINEARYDERERCAQVADAENDPNKDHTHGFWSHCAAKIAQAIREGKT